MLAPCCRGRLPTVARYTMSLSVSAADRGVWWPHPHMLCSLESLTLNGYSSLPRAGAVWSRGDGRLHRHHHALPSGRACQRSRRRAVYEIGERAAIAAGAARQRDDVPCELAAGRRIGVAGDGRRRRAHCRSVGRDAALRPRGPRGGRGVHGLQPAAGRLPWRQVAGTGPRSAPLGAATHRLSRWCQGRNGRRSRRAWCCPLHILVSPPQHPL